jgi:hypothetical protein
VRVFASGPGVVPASTESGVAGPATKNDIAYDDSGFLDVTMFNPSTLTIKATLPAGALTEAGVTLHYRWYVDADTAASTSSTLVLTSADWGKEVVSNITITKPGYNDVVAYSIPHDFTMYYDTPPITGIPQVGQQLGTTVGASTIHSGATVTPTSYSFQWMRSGTPIKGAVGPTYTLTAADFFTAISLRVRPNLAGWVSKFYETPVVGPIDGLHLAISGQIPSVARVSPTSTVLKAVIPPGLVITPGVTYTYQWTRNGIDTGGRGSTYAQVAADFGKDIQVFVTANKPSYDPWTFNCDPKNFSLVMGFQYITGTAQVGSVLTANAGPLDPDLTPTSWAYQWYRQGVSGGSLPVPGATASTYTLKPADVGSVFRVTIRPILAGYLTIPQLTPETAAISP